MSAAKPTILVVEDDENISRALTIRFEAEGFAVCQAFDALTALQAVEANAPELAVLDISMPGGDGIELARSLRSQPETAQLPIVFLTASKRPDLRERAGLIEASAFFEKPYDAKQLLAQVRELLGAVR